MKVSQSNGILDFQKTSEKQSEKAEKESDSKKQIVVEKDGEYASTYMIDGDGNKILISRIPIESSNNEHDAEEGVTSDAEIDISHGRQMYEASVHKKNVKEIMELVEISVGIPNKNGYDD
ncbi:hypothetical protein [Fusibacter sp. JL216-2]|uniref:hypothetical protein n=1 Tax=Fusibacter sp. JL216-2 TaxID=3071453 RepID=UPI003D3566DF